MLGFVGAPPTAVGMCLQVALGECQHPLAGARITIDLVQHSPDLKIQIFSGAETGNIGRALSGETLGTWILA